MVNTKAPVDLSIAVRKHQDPAVEGQVCVICPRRKGKPTERNNGSNPVALSLDFLRPLFKKPLTQVSEELGLSATAIKKACRRFGVPKWPFRTLTSKTSRNRASWDGPIARAPPQQTPSQLLSGMSPHGLGTSFSGDDAIGNHEESRQLDDLKKLEEDAKMISEVAALAEAREANKPSNAQDSHTSANGESLQESELSAARNLSLLSATVPSTNPEMDLGEMQMQAIRAWQQQVALQEGAVQPLAFAADGTLQPVALAEGAARPTPGSAASALSDGVLPKLQMAGAALVKEEGEAVPQLPSIHSNLMLPPPNMLAFSLPPGAQVMCPVQLTSLPLIGGAQFAVPASMAGGVPVQMFIPATIPGLAPAELVSPK